MVPPWSSKHSWRSGARRMFHSRQSSSLDSIRNSGLQFPSDLMNHPFRLTMQPPVWLTGLRPPVPVVILRHRGTRAVYRSIGRHAEIEFSWWNRPFLFWIISGTLVVIGLILRVTPWENRISLILLEPSALRCGVQGRYAAMQFVSAAVPGLLVVGLLCCFDLSSPW